MSGLSFIHPFWREMPLDDAERGLMAALFEAHHHSALRDNISSHAVLGTAIGNGTYVNAIASGLLTLGSLHGPIPQAMALLAEKHPGKIVGSELSHDPKVRIPGWGSSFAKDKPDPLWNDVHQIIVETWHELGQRINAVTEAFKKAGKPIQPNPACYTAAVALIVGMPPSCSPYLFLCGRMNAWSKMFMKHETSNQIWEG